MKTTILKSILNIKLKYKLIFHFPECGYSCQYALFPVTNSMTVWMFNQKSFIDFCNNVLLECRNFLSKTRQVKCLRGYRNETLFKDGSHINVDCRLSDAILA